MDLLVPPRGQLGDLLIGLRFAQRFGNNEAVAVVVLAHHPPGRRGRLHLTYPQVDEEC